MKLLSRLISVFIVSTIIFMGVFIVSAMAKNGPHAGPSFPDDTEACAGCHRTHTATTNPLLANDATSIYDFCIFCHDGTGANTNVVSGIFEGDANFVYKDEFGNDHNSINDGEAGAGLNGGGFLGAYAYSGRASRHSDYQSYSSGPEADKQRHNVTGSDLNTFIAWGGGSTGPGEEITGFTCISCHDPHGTENKDGTERYRILKGGLGMNPESTKVNGKSTATLRSNEMAAFGKHDYTRDAYETGITQFCAACHSQYPISSGTVEGGSSGKYDAGDDKGFVVRHRHKIVALGGLGDLPGIRGQGSSVWNNMNRRTTKLPVEQITYSSDIKPSDSIACLTCHQAHGTSSFMSDNAKTTPANSATLLRLSNRGVCEACHYK